MITIITKVLLKNAEFSYPRDNQTTCVSNKYLFAEERKISVGKELEQRRDAWQDNKEQSEKLHTVLPRVTDKQ